MTNNLNVAATAGLDKSRSIAQINQDIQKIEAQLKKLKLQATLEKGKSISEIQSQINALNKQKRNLYVDLKIRQKDLKRQYRQAIANIHTQPLNVDVNTAAAQSQMTGLTNSVKTTTSETVTLADSLKKALSNTGLVISSQTALQLVRKAAQEATEAVKEYDKYATNLSIITGGSKESSYETIADLSEKSFDFKVDISELENAYETLLRTGKAAGELDDYLKSTVFLSKVGFEDMDKSAENLVTIGNAFKLQSDEIENVVSSLVALDTASNTVAGKLSTAMSKTAQNAQLAGLNIDQLGAIISGLRDTTGRSENELATSLNGILTRLYNVKLGKYKIELEDGSTEDITESLNNVEDMLKTVGMNIRTSKGEFKDVADIIDELVTKWDKLNDVQKNAVGFTFAGTYHKNTFISLVENWERIKELTDISADSAGQASEKYNAYLDSVEAKSAALNTAVKDMWNNLIPNNLAGDLTEAATSVVQFTDKYQVLQTTLKSAAFYALAKGVITAKNGFVGMVTDIKNVSTAMNMASKISTLSAQEFAALKNITSGLSDKQLKLVLSTNELTYADKLNIVQTGNMTKAEAEQKLATLGITQANTTATASTFSLSGAFKALWASIAANPIGALTIAFTGLVTIYQTVKRKQEEQIEGIKETADKAKKLTDNINELYSAYTDMKTGVENGTESKENLTTATNNLLEALGYEGTAVDELVDKYGNLSDAINQATADTLKNSLPDLADAVDVELGELLETGSNVVSFTLDDTKANKELNDFVQKFSDKTAGLNMLHGTSDSTFRVIVDTDKNSADGLKQELDILNSLRNELFDYYGAENIQDIDFYKQLTDRITKLTEAYNDYSQSFKNYNDTAAQAQIIESLVGKEIPQTVEEYKAYRQELINSAKNSDQFIGSQEDIINAIDGTLGKMSEFEAVQNRLNNLDLAKTMFVEGKFNAKPISDYINSLSDEKLAILVQLDKNAFDNGIEGVEKAIADFKADPDNTVKVETDTSSLDDLKEAYENVSKSADSFIKNQKSLKSALEEQEKHGQLSASTIRELSEAGCSEALVTDKVTGAVTLDMQAYEKLNAQKQEKIRLDLENEKNDLEEKLRDEQSAVSDLKQEYEALAKADMEANAGRLSEITLELAKRGANIEDIRGLISQINGDITSLTAPSFENDNTDKNKEAFDKLYSQWNHDLEMNKVTQDEYINWLDGAYKQYFSDLTKYQDEYNKYEEEVYKARSDREQNLFDKKIDNLEKLADKALDNYKDGDGNELTITASFDYARDQINKAITEIQARIDGIRNGTISGNTDDIEALIDDLDSLNDKLIDINKKEIESEKDYISELKDNYSDMMDERIDKVNELSDKIEDSYDKQIDALEKLKDTEDRIKKIKDAQLEVKEKEKALDEAKREDAKNSYVYFDGAGMSVQTSTENQQKAQQELEESRKDLEEAYREEEINVLKEQKEAATTYYDNVKDNLEKQKTQGEKTYEAVEKIYEKLGGDKKQTSSNAELVKKLSKSGDISKAMSELSDTERQKVIDTGVVKVQPNGDYTFDYSAFEKYSSTVDDNTLATQDLTSILKDIVTQADTDKDKTDNSMVAGGFNLVADPKTGKLTKKQVMVNGEVVEGLGHKVYATSKEEWQEHNNSEKTSKGSFAGYDTFIDFIRAVSAGKVDISPLTNAFNSGYNPLVDKMNKSVSDTINNVSNSNVNNVNNKPVVNLTVNVEGSADKKTVEAFRNVVTKEIGTAFDEFGKAVRNAKV